MKGVYFFPIITILTKIKKVEANKTTFMIHSNERDFNYYILSPEQIFKNLSHAFVSLMLGKSNVLRKFFFIFKTTLTT